MSMRRPNLKLKLISRAALESKYGAWRRSLALNRQAAWYIALMNDHSREAKKAPKLLGFLVLLLLLPYALIYLFLYFSYGLILQIAVWISWMPRGKSILIVTSESPVWEDYMAENIIGVLQAQAMILNWSKRSEWSRPHNLQVLAFNYYGGKSDFNPLVVVFRPFRRAKVFRFWQAFKNSKHGKTPSLEQMREKLLEYTHVNQSRAV